jgi:hypothetical protein
LNSKYIIQVTHHQETDADDSLKRKLLITFATFFLALRVYFLPNHLILAPAAVSFSYTSDDLMTQYSGCTRQTGLKSHPRGYAVGFIREWQKNKRKVTTCTVTASIAVVRKGR